MFKNILCIAVQQTFPPAHKGGRPALLGFDDAYDDILRVVRTGMQWRYLRPTAAVAYITVFKTMHKWIDARVSSARRTSVSSVRGRSTFADAASEDDVFLFGQDQRNRPLCENCHMQFMFATLRSVRVFFFIKHRPNAAGRVRKGRRHMAHAVARMHASWKPHVIFDADLDAWVANERAQHTVYPPIECVFDALVLPLQSVKAIIVGQDPYHGAGQAHGLSFSVPNRVRPPPSLVNILRETRVNDPRNTSGNLTSWVEQGVLLLNTVMTVRANTPRSHRGKGWERITDAIIRSVLSANPCVVVMLWGRDAQRSASKMTFGDDQLVLMASHPSPLGCMQHAPVPFVGCDHFSKTNEHLLAHGLSIIDWKLP
jgi:uracil-DNA glycosylase